MILALKQLLRRPVYFLAVVLVLATGLGGAVSLYAIADAVLFRPLRVQDPAALVRIFQTNAARTARNGWSLPQIREDLLAVEAFAGVAYFYDGATFAWSPGKGPRETLAGGVASGNFFELLGIKPFLGRLLQAGDDVRGAPIVGVMSWEAWQSRFAADPGIIGESITLNDRLVTIVGVTPPGFSGVSLNRRPDIWLPVSSAAGIAVGAPDEGRFLESRTLHWIDVVARLRTGVSAEQANRAMEAANVIHVKNETYPAAAIAVPARDVAVSRYGNSDAGDVSGLLLGLVGVLLVIVCADVAGLMLVRAEVQRAETGLRMSLGASRGRIAMNVLAEAAVISAFAGAVALLLAMVMASGLQQTLLSELVLPKGPGLILNARVLVAFGIMLVTVSLLAGIAPMRRLAGTSLMRTLGAARQGERRAVNLRELLVVLQAGISMVLLTTAISFSAALLDTLKTDPGFKIDNRAVSLVNTGSSKEDSPAIFREMLRNLRADGRIASAALADTVPVSPWGFRIGGLAPQGYIPAAGENIVVDVNAVSEGYFQTLGIALLQGRDFDSRDFSRNGDGLATANVIVNRAFVDTYWTGRPPLGLVVGDTGGVATRMTVIGVVENYRQRSLQGPPVPVIHVPFTQLPATEMNVVAYAASSDIALQAISDAVRETDAALKPGSGMSLGEHLDIFTAPDRALTSLAIGAAVFATLLSVAGMYGVAAYAARQRQHEIGIRFAVGATKAQVMRQFLWRGVIIALFGILAGLVATALGGKALDGAIAGADTGRPLPWLAAALLFALVALLANLVPVWRAADNAPMEVLRDE